MAAELTREWSDEQLKSDDLAKKDIIKFLQDHGADSVGVQNLLHYRSDTIGMVCGSLSNAGRLLAIAAKCVFCAASCVV